LAFVGTYNLNGKAFGRDVKGKKQAERGNYDELEDWIRNSHKCASRGPQQLVEFHTKLSRFCEFGSTARNGEVRKRPVIEHALVSPPIHGYAYEPWNPLAFATLRADLRGKHSYATGRRTCPRVSEVSIKPSCKIERSLVTVG